MSAAVLPAPVGISSRECPRASSAPPWRRVLLGVDRRSGEVHLQAVQIERHRGGDEGRRGVGRRPPPGVVSFRFRPISLVPYR